ncbi:MAG: hypothetical protein F4Y38_05820 [Gemmatimonadetes bacterium]|nr:substrate-binding domain-containing protein [Gemmatimonadota bacterium]MXY48805.1 hypothetical protein [Gemmatimonadota bacterium]MYG84663.1 hypothetical protein [Gemmatimonadota bacterium]MYJ90821.1 hypothetical protein [Gemmatimonadota bacterium]
MAKFGVHFRLAFSGAALLFFMTGCGQPDETATRGYLKVSSAEVAFPYIESSAVKYQQVYNEAFIDVAKTTSREALVDLSEGRSRLAVLSREPNESEVEALSAGEADFITRTVAHDALAVIVHGDNPVEDLTLGQLRDIYTGNITNWRELGGKDMAIRPLVRDRNSGTYEVFEDVVLEGAEYGANVYPCSTMAALASIAGAYPGTIGITGLLITRSTTTMAYYKTIRIAEDESGPYLLPTQHKLLQELYPLRRPLVLCYFKRSSLEVNLVSGYVTFLTAVKGQQIAIDEGVVPATMPVRTVKLQ